VVAGPQAEQLTRAWLAIGIGGLSLFMVVFATSHVSWLGTWIATLGATMVLRGARVVSKAGPHLLPGSIREPLPAARVMPARPRGDDGDVR